MEHKRKIQFYFSSKIKFNEESTHCRKKAEHKAKDKDKVKINYIFILIFVQICIWWRMQYEHGLCDFEVFLYLEIIYTI